MKKYAFLVLALVLTTGLLVGCGCTNRDAQYTTVPTTMPTIATMPTTENTTVPTQNATVPSTHETIDNGNGPLEDGRSTTATDETIEGRARSNVNGTARSGSANMG